MSEPIRFTSGGICISAPSREERIADIYKRFTYHAPKGDQTDRYHALRESAKKLAILIDESTPMSREQSLALTHLETAIFFANAAIARNE